MFVYMCHVSLGYEFNEFVVAMARLCGVHTNPDSIPIWIVVFIVSGSGWSYQLLSDLIMSWCQSWQSGWSWKIFWLPKNSSRLTRLPRLSGPSHRNKTHLIMLDKKNYMICWDVLRSTTICDSRAFTSWYDKMRVDTCLCALPRMQPTDCEFLRLHIYWTRFMYDLRYIFQSAHADFPSLLKNAFSVIC